MIITIPSTTTKINVRDINKPLHVVCLHDIVKNDHDVMSISFGHVNDYIRCADILTGCSRAHRFTHEQMSSGKNVLISPLHTSLSTNVYFDLCITLREDCLLQGVSSPDEGNDDDGSEGIEISDTECEFYDGHEIHRGWRVHHKRLNDLPHEQCQANEVIEITLPVVYLETMEGTSVSTDAYHEAPFTDIVTVSKPMKSISTDYCLSIKCGCCKRMTMPSSVKSPTSFRTNKAGQVVNIHFDELPSISNKGDWLQLCEMIVSPWLYHLCCYVVFFVVTRCRVREPSRRSSQVQRCNPPLLGSRAQWTWEEGM